MAAAAWWSSISGFCVFLAPWKGRQESPKWPPMLVEVIQVDRSERAPGLFSQVGPCPNTSSWVRNSKISIYFGQICIFSNPRRTVDHPAGSGLEAPQTNFPDSKRLRMSLRKENLKSLEINTYLQNHLSAAFWQCMYSKNLTQVSKLEKIEPISLRFTLILLNNQFFMTSDMTLC